MRKLMLKPLVLGLAVATLGLSCAGNAAGRYGSDNDRGARQSRQSEENGRNGGWTDCGKCCEPKCCKPRRRCAPPCECRRKCPKKCCKPNCGPCRDRCGC